MTAAPTARAAWITPLGELLSPPRMAGTAARLGIQICLVVFLWRPLQLHGQPIRPRP